MNISASNLNVMQNSFHQDMSQWFECPLGRSLLGVESELLEKALSRRFGYHLLELGCSNLNMFRSSPIGHKFSFAPVSTGAHCALAKTESIPLSRESVDLVLLHHTLDYSDDRHQLLREASRILIEGGHIVIVGFNPYSTWGLRNKLQWRKKMPWQGSRMSPLRLTDWLKLLDFQVEQVKYGVYSLPFNSPRIIRYSSIMNRLAMRLNWPTGAIYVIVAKKQVAPLTPVQSGWKRFPSGVGLPTAKNIGGASRHICESHTREFQ